VATVVVAKWEGELDESRMRQLLSRDVGVAADEPEALLIAREATTVPSH
jgi:hypothetical protein